MSRCSTVSTGSSGLIATFLLRFQGPKAPIEIVERELWRTTDWPLGRGVAGEVAEQHLLHRAKETLNAPAAPWLSGERMEQAHVEIDTDLVKMG